MRLAQKLASRFGNMAGRHVLPRMAGAVIRNDESNRNVTLGESLRLVVQLNNPAMKPLRNLGWSPRLYVVISVRFALLRSFRIWAARTRVTRISNTRKKY